MTRIAVVQFCASVRKEDNLERILGYVADAAAKRAVLCAFPEFMMMYTDSSQSPADLARLAEPMDGRFVTAVCDAARRHSIEVVGTTYESDGSGAVYDTAFLAGSNGSIVSKYRKVHLYDALGFSESEKLAAGAQMPDMFESGCGRMGMMVCYDIRFPEVARSLATAGAQILAVPSAWVSGEAKVDHWITMNKARAVENGCFVIAPDHVGNTYCGHSLVVDPFGKIITDMQDKEGMSVVDIDVGQVEQVRQKLPLLKNRRTDLYG